MKSDILVIDVREMLAREKTGFSLDASVRIAVQDRAVLERHLRSPAVRA